MSPSDIQIKIYDQSIEFYNPGKLYGDITIEDLKMDTYTSKLRNKLIAEAFYLTKDIEKYGTGFFRIRKEIRDYPTMKFQYKEQVGGFLTELSYVKQKITTGSPNDTVNGTVNGISRAGLILRAIEHNNKISITKLTQQVRASRMTIIRDLNKLNAQGRISRVSPDKGGYWQIINPQESNENYTDQGKPYEHKG